MVNAAWRWARKNLFADGWSAAVTVALAIPLLLVLMAALRWAVLEATTSADPEACRAAAGACWGVVVEKGRVILFGRYPHAEQWRAAGATGLLAALLLVSGHPRAWRPSLAFFWLAGLAAVLVLLGGGVAGLAPVATELWGGLPLTLLLTTGGIGLAFPLALALALGRLSPLPVLRGLITIYVEVVRGLPLIPVLFLASFLLPLFLPPGTDIDVLFRVLAAIVLFAAAYLSETLRGGLAAVPAGQEQAALAMGMSARQSLWLIVLPQALRAVVPSLMNSAIALFKDTSLVTVVSLFDLTGALTLALAGDAQWRPFYFEAYVFVAAIYWLGCFGFSRYAAWLESRLGITP